MILRLKGCGQFIVETDGGIMVAVCRIGCRRIVLFCRIGILSPNKYCRGLRY